MENGYGYHGEGGGTTDSGSDTSTAGGSTGLASRTREYGQTVTDAASTAKDYIADKASVVGDKISDLRNVDYGQLADDAKDYARQNPGQALLVAAAAGFILGFLIRGRRR